MTITRTNENHLSQKMNNGLLLERKVKKGFLVYKPKMNIFKDQL